MSKKGLLAVSFGTSHEDAFKENILPVEQRMSAEFPERELRRAFGSKMIIKKLMNRDGIHVDTVAEAMESFKNDGFTDILVQPTFFIPGIEYDMLLSALEPFKACFDSLKIGLPLIWALEDYEVMLEAIPSELYPKNKNEALILMGHGTEHFANAAYPALEHIFAAKGYKNVFVATVDGYPDFQHVREAVWNRGIKKVTIMPLMLVAGDHAKNDMAGEDEDSWKSILSSDGIDVDCVIKGMGSIEAIQKHFADHAKAAEQN